mmetsp:Transcript_9223/g.26224  ORF Transcript_9223/g.26224 Transcript_9223/m.26224 type:complete len:216 (-) Transcript_9223:32-679(-)
MDSSPSREHEENVLEAEVLAQTPVQDTDGDRHESPALGPPVLLVREVQVIIVVVHIDIEDELALNRLERAEARAARRIACTAGVRRALLWVHVVDRPDIYLRRAPRLDRALELAPVLEALVPHEDVPLQGEAELPPREEGLVCLWVFGLGRVVAVREPLVHGLVRIQATIIQLHQVLNVTTFRVIHLSHSGHRVTFVPSSPPQPNSNSNPLSRRC